MSLKVGDIVRFDHPNGSIGKIVCIRTDGPFKKNHRYYVEWTYGRDRNGQAIRAMGAYSETALVNVSEEEYNKIHYNPAFGA